MGYLHIENLYKNQDILLFKECYELEKVHGTSAHISFQRDRMPQIIFFSGGEKHTNFVALFDHGKLLEKFIESGASDVTINGEAYGGKCQGMSETYGKELKFIAFDVRICDCWLAVPQAADFCATLGLEFVPWSKISTDLDSLNAARDKPSEVAVRRGCGEAKLREGVILRPLIELTKNNSDRVICKHKADKFSERATPQKVVTADKLVILQAAQAIADEWVTHERLRHIIDKLKADDPLVGDINMQHTPHIINRMIEDVYREAKGEIVESKEAKNAIGARTGKLFKEWVKNQLVAI